EGTIPKGEYGAGTVMLWDVGRWQPDGRNDADRLDFILTGAKLRGAWTLVRLRDRGSSRHKGKQWLLIKRTDRPRRRLQLNDLSVISGRSMEEIAAHDHEAESLPPPPVAREIPGAHKGSPPATLSPQLGTPTEQAPKGRNWLHEIKFDGYRIVAHIEHGEVRLVTRNGHDWTDRFRAQAGELVQLPVEQAVLDGELVALSESGASSFHGLQEAISRKQTAHLIYQVF
ncbi:MAG: ATP-dependent DNA ligase, partial [Anaerolineae bacterium]|nr:ATP-dependent DNA ligase [Anaerolineae bacterium]